MAYDPNTIHKYPLFMGDEVAVMMPAGAKVLHVGEQEGGLTLWAQVDQSQPFERRVFSIRGTGHPLGEVGRFIGTVVMSYGLVWHIYEGV